MATSLTPQFAQEESRDEVGGYHLQSIFCGLGECRLPQSCSLGATRTSEVPDRLLAVASGGPVEVSATWLDRRSEEPTRPRPVVFPLDSQSLGEPPPFDDLPDQGHEPEPELRPEPQPSEKCCPGKPAARAERRLRAGGRWDGACAGFLGPCAAFAVAVISLALVGYGVGATEFECTPIDPYIPMEAYLIHLAVAANALFVTTPAAVVLLAKAATSHLRAIALYLFLLWSTKPHSCLVAINDCARRPLEEIVTVKQLAPLVDPAMLAVTTSMYLCLFTQRLQALEASSFRRLGVRTVWWLMLLFMLGFVAACVCVALIFLGQAQSTEGTPVVVMAMGSSLWFAIAVWVLVIGGATRVLLHSRACLSVVGAAGSRRITAEATRASRAMVMQIIGLVVGFTSTFAKVMVFTAYNELLWPLPKSSLVAAKLYIGELGPYAHVFDDVGNIWAALTLSGCFSGALRAASRAQVWQRQRQRRWARSAAEWQQRSGDSGPAWEAKVEEMAMRGISLEEILRFYRGLGSAYMEHYSPTVHTTADVVWQAVIPVTCESRGALSALLMNGQRRRAQRMVTHTWHGLFSDLVAAIVADALGEPEYAMVSYLLQRDVGRLEQWVRDLGKHSQTYWVCAFCVNQHLSICTNPPEELFQNPIGHDAVAPCPCGLAKALNDTKPTSPDGRSIPCEMNKFTDMMLFLSAGDPHFKHVVAVDRDFTLFSRAWCVSEIAVASSAGMEQQLKLSSAEGLARHEEEMRGLRIQDMQASRPEDKRVILAGIPDVEGFNSHMQKLLFEDLIPAWSGLDASEQMFRAGRLIRWQGVTDQRRSLGLWRASES